jgi:hypothetical protein
MRAGDFIAKEFAGTSAGLTDAITYCGSNGVITLYPGNSSITIPSLVAKPGIRIIKHEAGFATEYGQGGLTRPFLNVRDYGATGDGTTDDTAKIQAAINAASYGDTVFIPGPNAYSVLELAGKSGVSIVSNGAKLKKQAGSPNSYALRLSGGASSNATSLSANAVSGDTVISMSSVTGFAAGDFVLLLDDTYKIPATSNGRNKELNRIESVGASTITLRNRLIGGYATASNAAMHKAAPVYDASVSGLIVEVPIGTNTGGGIRCQDAYGCTVKDCMVLYPNDGLGFVSRSSQHIRFLNCTARDGQNTAAGGFGYGFWFADSIDVIAIGCLTENVRESAMSLNTRYSGFIDCVDIGSYDDSWNSHSSGIEGCFIIGCTSIACRGSAIVIGFNGGERGDEDISVINNTIINPGVNGIYVGGASTSLRTTGVVVANNTIRGTSRAIDSHGILVLFADDITIHANVIADRASVSVGSGIYLEDVTNSIVKDNRLHNLAKCYGLRWKNATDCIFIGNKLVGIEFNNLRSDGGTNAVTLRDNISDDLSHTLDGNEVLGRNVYGTKFDQTTGTATVANGTTSIAVTHNSATTPVAGDIIVTPTNNLGNAVMFWITAIGATTFTINVDVDPGATTATFGWQVNVS